MTTLPACPRCGSPSITGDAYLCSACWQGNGKEITLRQFKQYLYLFGGRDVLEECEPDEARQLWANAVEHWRVGRKLKRGIESKP